MCGIAGIVGSADRGVITQMSDRLAHRGPDDAGAIVLEPEGVALGHRRLSIIDLSPAGHQPMPNHDSTLWITFNGEIYNYRELKQALAARGFRFRSETDTEVLLAAYEAWGLGCLERLNGMFAFAIYDRKRKRLFAARDRLGIKPFYYYCRPGLFVFASEIKALFACPEVPKRPDYASLCTPARSQVSPHTGFEHIFKLSPGHFLCHECDELTLKSYWDIPVSEKSGLGDMDCVVARLDELLRDAARLQMVADVPVGVFLSGGLDSSLIAALMRAETSGDIHAFTIRFSEKDQRHEGMPDDSAYAKQVARRFEFRYHEFEIKPELEELFPKLVFHLDEPLSDPAALNTYLMSRAARNEGIVVLLNGMGGDEIFGGYRKHLACLQAEWYQRLVPEAVRMAAERAASRLPVATSSRGLRTVRWMKRFLSFASLPPFERYLASDLALSKERFESVMRCGRYEQSIYYGTQKASFDKHDVSLLTRMCVNDTRFFLPEHNLTYTDRATMAAGVESRPPLTDHRVVEFMFSLSPQYRIRRNRQKYLLKKVAERYLPRNVVHRPKAPFASPLRSWIRGPLAGLVDDLLAGSSMRSRELYEPKHVREVILRDRAGLEDNALVIWTFLTNELWFRTHFG